MISYDFHDTHFYPHTLRLKVPIDYIFEQLLTDLSTPHPTSYSWLIKATFDTTSTAWWHQGSHEEP